MSAEVEKTYTMAEVAKHNTAKDLWIVLGEDESCLKVYDVTKYHKGHPGGADIMIENGGTNAYSLFAAAVHSDMALKQMTKYCIGCVADETKDIRGDNKTSKHMNYTKVCAIM